ncbi:MAG: hypothetical protein HY748_08020 [Elusimicrobia bacterium]|nr:hypothetical protein [Elusimicrobiota bacterium]
MGETFNIANGRCYSLLDIVRVIERILGRKVELKFHPKRKGDVRKTYADISRARRPAPGKAAPRPPGVR